MAEQLHLGSLKVYEHGVCVEAHLWSSAERRWVLSLSRDGARG